MIAGTCRGRRYRTEHGGGDTLRYATIWGTGSKRDDRAAADALAKALGIPARCVYVSTDWQEFQI